MKYVPTLAERKKYVLSTKKDIYMLATCKELESKILSPEDKRLCRLIKSQLEEDWRKPLIKIIKDIAKKY